MVSHRKAIMPVLRKKRVQHTHVMQCRKSKSQRLSLSRKQPVRYSDTFVDKLGERCKSIEYLLRPFITAGNSVKSAKIRVRMIRDGDGAVSRLAPIPLYFSFTFFMPDKYCITIMLSDDSIKFLAPMTLS